MDLPMANCAAKNRTPRGARCAWRLAPLAAVAALLATGCGFNARKINGEGVAMFQTGNLDAAETAFQQALSHDPQDPNVYYNLARVHHQRGMQTKDSSQFAQAETYYNRCLDFADNHEDCYRALAVMLVEQDRADEAFTLLERWALRSPQLAEPKIELARLYEEFEEPDVAKEKLLEALTIDADNSRALAALGAIHERQGDYTQALANYRRSLWHNRQQPEVAARVALLQASGARAGDRDISTPGSRLVNPQFPTFR